MKKEISIILPVYNEEKNIENVVRSIVNFMPGVFDKFEIILVDDGSNDQTPNIIKKISEGDAVIKTVRHPKNIGYGAALISGFKVSHYPLLFFMDSDGQFDMSEIKRLLPYSEKFDIVAGIRTARRDSLYRVFAGRMYNSLICLLFGIKTKDITCGFKLFKRQVFDKMELKSRGGFLNVEMLVKSKRLGYTIKEVGISHLPRTLGKETGASLKAIILKISDIFRLWADLH